MPCHLRVCRIFSSWRDEKFFSVPLKSGCWRSNFHRSERCSPKDKKYKQISSSFWKFNKESSEWHKQNPGSVSEARAQALGRGRPSLRRSAQMSSVWYPPSPADPQPTSGTSPCPLLTWLYTIWTGFRETQELRDVCSPATGKALLCLLLWVPKSTLSWHFPPGLFAWKTEPALSSPCPQFLAQGLTAPNA